MSKSKNGEIEPRSSKFKSNNLSTATYNVHVVAIILINNTLKHVSVVLPSTDNEIM